ncbi:MAG: general secretion pathway protein GspD [Flavobacterium sp.]|nr:MAG: general secretion pathway protein GspD [Flavobacterium sp.]
MKKTIITILLLLLFLGKGFSQDTSRVLSLKNELELLKVSTPGLEEIININITQTTLPNFLLAISKVHSLNINVSPELNSISIVNNFSNVSVEDILMFLVKEYNLDIEFTGNILSIKKYTPPVLEDKEKKINVIYLPPSNLLSLDLKKDKLDRVFRKIMDVSGKNLLYAPDLESHLLSIYIKDTPFDIALEKLAESNNLELTKSNDGFYVFSSAFEDLAIDETNKKRPVRKKRASFYYRVLDTLNRRVTVDFKNTPISDIIYTIGEDLDLDIFTASPLDDAGTATVTAENISFDLLLDKIFESTGNNQGSASTNSKESIAKFTYKKEGNIYYFGTENQLSLKQVEVIPMMYRSIKLLSDPSGAGQRKAGRTTSFNTNPVNYINGANQNQNNRNNTNRNSTSTTNSSSNSNNSISIEDIIPDDIKDGLDIKIDFELNSFIVSGSGAKVERFKKFVTFIDKPVPVILIEVMILEVNRSAIIETGIKFGLGEEPTQTIGEVFPSTNIRLGSETINKVIGSFSGFGALNLGSVLPEFYLDIKAMESNGTIKVLSTPKLSTLNGHKATLSSGQTTYYAVTTQNFFGTQTPVNSEITNYVPIDAELAIEILPFVSGNGEITLDIQVIQSAFNGERIAEDAPPGINSREFSSIIRMRDQDVAILGGIEEVRKDDSGTGLPLLSRVPVLKWIFGSRRREDSKKNLNILIKPTIIY